jgi:hypothetical protein
MSRQRSALRKKTAPPGAQLKQVPTQELPRKTDELVSRQRNVKTARSTSLPHRPARSHQSVSSTTERKDKERLQARSRITTRRSLSYWQDYLLWAVAIATLLLGCYSLAGGSLSWPIQSAGQPVLASPDSGEPNHPILRVNRVTLTSDQWHNAVQSAFSARASSGNYQGGTQADTLAINTAAMHSLLDPLALTSLAQSLGIPTDTNTLYQEWLRGASAKDRETARQHEGDLAFQQSMADAQLRFDVVKKAAPLPVITSAQAYQFYVRHPEQFARAAPQMQLQQIVVRSLSLAQQIYQALLQGESFTSLEAAYDISSPFYRARGGDLGWVALGGSAYPPEWTAHALALRPGQIAAPFSAGGLSYILKCSAGPDYQPWPFADVQEQARQDLEQEMLQATLTHLLENEEKTMLVEVLDAHFAGIWQEFQASLSQ